MPFDLLIEIIAEAAPELLDSLAEEGFDLAEMGLEQVDLDDLHNLDTGEFSNAISGADLPIEAEGVVDVLDGEAYTENFYQTINEGGVENNSYIDSVFETDEAFIDETLIDDFTDYPELNNFELSGFGNAEIAQQALFESVPAEHIDGISGINYDPEFSDAFGMYNPSNQEITIFNADPATNILTFQHEVGHHLLEQNPGLQNAYLEARAIDATSLGLEALNVDPSRYHWSHYIHESFARDYSFYLNAPEAFSEHFTSISKVFESTISNLPVA